MELYTTSKAIDTACVALHAAGQTVQNEMHKVACSVLVHYAKNNDKRVVEKLLKAMPESARTNALRDWMNFFGTMSIGAKDEIVTVPGKKLKLADAMAKPFWKFSPEKAYVPLDVHAAITGLIKKLERDAKETALDHSNQINALRAMILPTSIAEMAAPKAPKAVKLVDGKASNVTTDPLAA